ncbi:MAG: hypothetical protein JNN00_17485 [Chitinophagaceae bacterium]|nr:hypothetical protein [Chitinophagaceae bacterium]
MPEFDSFGSFFRENKKLVKDYFDTRLDIFRLKMIRIFSKSAGYLIWILISVFLLFLFIIFLGVTTGFWLSSLTGSYTKGFGLTTLVILAVIVILALLRKVLFVNPIIRNIIHRAADDSDTENENIEP